MRALFVTFLLAATAAPVAQDQPSAHKPTVVNKDCNCGTAYRTTHEDCDCGTTSRTSRDWNLHRPSTAAERAETGRLNREFLVSARATPQPPPPGPDPAQLAYQQQMKNYRALTESYERRMRAYNRLHTQAYLPPPAQQYRQDAARLDPWRGYNPGPGNGY